MARKTAKKKVKKVEVRPAAARRRNGAKSPPVPALGSAGWMDLTVPNADEVRDFYSAVIGWKADAIDMGGYSDYCMAPPGATAPLAGVCHARGANDGLPRCWLVYFMVADVMKAVAEVERRGGRVLRPAGPMGSVGRFAVIEDPAGAVCALHQAAR